MASFAQRWEAEEASKRQKMAARQLEEVCACVLENPGVRLDAQCKILCSGGRQRRWEASERRRVASRQFVRVYACGLYCSVQKYAQ